MIIILYIVTHKSYELMKSVGDCSTKCGNGIQINKTTTCTISLSDPLDCTTKSENGTCKLEECPQEYTFNLSIHRQKSINFFSATYTSTTTATTKTALNKTIAMSSSSKFYNFKS